MNADEMLNRIEKNSCLIAQKKQQIQSLYEILDSMGVDTTKEVVFSSADDKMSSVITRIVVLKEELEEQRVAAEEEKNEIISFINNIGDSTLQNVLYERYVNNKSLLEISRSIGYTYEWTRHLHLKAKREFEKSIKTCAKSTTKHTKTQ